MGLIINCRENVFSFRDQSFQLISIIKKYMPSQAIGLRASEKFT